ncbi:fumarylacetoacetate hydrolase family protein [Paraburkholderia metrosideri]|uniref:Fumarylacetoacetate (FAA) hydrolase n=1 Tax=Paraburkholderia metrosideri TaxID=580937 RepID=A0ABM8NTV6_9BURK|nr:fumarylacetoacetate hydrolase family protein [Paraburkholderia metrosideri]CAD6543194.1 hypothetical protein LMG28140_03886 [Paraburkholderia metrosideri]
MVKLVTLKNGNRDGELAVVSADLTRFKRATTIAPTLQAALDAWQVHAPLLATLYEEVNAEGLHADNRFDPARAMAPMPRAYQWLDGSAFLAHGELMQRAFNLPASEDAARIPLMYQGGSDAFIGPHDDITLESEELALDFEGEFGVIVGDVPMGCNADDALKHVLLVVQINDVSLRALAPREMKTGFGFLQSKPSSSFAPAAVTLDELGAAWRDGRVALPLHVSYNGDKFGSPDGAEMDFSFGDLIAHAARTRPLSAGTIVGSGTVSNRGRAAGSACITERRMIELISEGAARTPFMTYGDRVRMEARTSDGNELFGAIDQQVRRAA